MKFKKFLKEKKTPIIIASGVLVASLLGGGYYLANKQESPFGKTETTTEEKAATITTTDPQVQQNVEEKNEAATGQTTTPAVVAEKPALSSLSDVSFTILRDTDMVQAYVSFYGPFGTYGVEKLVAGNWTVLIPEFSYSGNGDKYIDTIKSADAESHYRVFKLEGGARTAISGDTTITWQEILSKGAFSVPLAG